MRALFLFIVLLLLCAPLFAQQNSDPDKVKFVTTDIDNFWRAYDLVQKESDRAAKIGIYQREYSENI